MRRVRTMKETLTHRTIYKGDTRFPTHPTIDDEKSKDHGCPIRDIWTVEREIYIGRSPPPQEDEPR
jgi:hypothetical protein